MGVAGRALACVIFLATVHAVPLTAQKGQARGPVPAPRPPRIECDLATETSILAGSELTFRVEGRDPDGLHVSLVLLNPPPGMVFDPVVNGPSPSAVDVRWRVPYEPAGRTTLVFEARDDTGLRARLERTVQVLAGFQQSVMSAEVTGDSVLDVVAGAYQADVNGSRNAGAVFVWAGASTPSAAPTARLSVPGALPFDELGSLGYAIGQTIQAADVTGDGQNDLVVTAGHARIGGVADGALYVFTGGDALKGEVAPRATLVAPGAGGIGDIGFGQGTLLEDVTGDGVLDVIAGCQGANVGGVRAGALYLYVGGAALQGTVAPIVLAVPGAIAGDHLGHADLQGILVGDVTGDGVRDVIAGAEEADVGGVVNAGAVYVWAGASAPSSTPSALLTVPGAVPGDSLGAQRLGQGLRLADLSGDGILDVVVGTTAADIGGVANVGAIYVFAGGATLTGAVAPRARFAVPGATANDQMGPDRAEGFRIADVTGDGCLDVIAASMEADIGGVLNAGAVYVFTLGGGSGSISPLATLTVPGAHANFGLTNALSCGLFLVDLTGDGVLDIVTDSVGVTVESAIAAGAIHLFTLAGAGGAVVPHATLTVTGAVSGDWLGSTYGGYGLAFADVTRDGKLDIVAQTHNADVDGQVDAGAIYVFSGAKGFEGDMHQAARLTVPGGRARDDMFLFSIADVTGDGALDILAGASTDVGPGFDAGAIHLFSGELAGEVHPSATMTVPVPTGGDLLRATHLADLTHDGVLDVVGWALSDVSDVFDAGAIYVYPGGRHSGLVLPALTLSAQNPGREDLMYPALIADFTGDGLLDLLGQASSADVGGVRDAGALYLSIFPRSGGPGAVRTTMLSIPNAQPGDQLGR